MTSGMMRRSRHLYLYRLETFPCTRLIPFPNHLCLGAKPQAVLTYDKAKQQQHG
jgi:hypothetical protein